MNRLFCKKYFGLGVCFWGVGLFEGAYLAPAKNITWINSLPVLDAGQYA